MADILMVHSGIPSSGSRAAPDASRRGHSALISDACCARAKCGYVWGGPIARQRLGNPRGGRSCCHFHRIASFAPSRTARVVHACSPWPFATYDCLCCAMLATVPGNFARATGERS